VINERGLSASKSASFQAQILPTLGWLSQGYERSFCKSFSAVIIGFYLHGEMSSLLLTLQTCERVSPKILKELRKPPAIDLIDQNVIQQGNICG